MKLRIFGGLTGILLGLSVVVIAPAAANALSWSTYADGYYSIGARPSSVSTTVYQNRGRINPPASGVAYTQRFDVLENKTKGRILASVSSGTGVWVTLHVSAPISNSVGRCYVLGPSHPLGAHHVCQVFK